jgi:hypothetical protein
MELSSSRDLNGRNSRGSRGCGPKIALAFAFLLLPPILLLLVCRATRFPPQIFGTPEDHFRAFVMNPIPKSVNILNVEANDLIIHPDVIYSFRFSINREDLEKIIAYNSLQSSGTECPAPSQHLEWWDITTSDDMEVYQYSPSKYDYDITLCYYVPSGIAYYEYFSY